MKRVALTHARARWSPASTRRPGYALLAVLWICVGIGGIGLTISSAAREARAGSRNRIALAEAEWLAHACLAHTRSWVARLLAAPPDVWSGRGPNPWYRLDEVLAQTPAQGIGECTIGARAVGARVDVNAADESWLARVLTRAGLAGAAADSIAAALTDWKDADDEPRPLGAEREWYVQRNMIPPGNRPFADKHELALVRGITSFSWEELLDVEPGPISILQAPAPVLAALPGLTQDAVARIVDLRRRGALNHYVDVAEGIAPGAAASFMNALPELTSRVVLEPVGWVVTAEASAGSPRVHVVVEQRLERAGSRVRVARQRSWTR